VNAFAAAAAVLAADSNIGAPATYTASGGSPLSLRVVLSRPEEALGGLDAPRGIAIAAVAMLPAAALTTRPARGAALSVDGVAYLVAEVVQDEIAAAYTLHLRRAPPPVTP